MEEILEGLKSFDPGLPDPSEIISSFWTGGFTYGHTEETKQRLRDFNTGKKMSSSAKNKISQSKMGNTWNKGRTIPQEQREKIRQTMLGVKHTSERKRNQSLAKVGVKHTAERNAKKSTSQKGKHWYNNGKINKLDYTCPNEFVPGMIKRRQRD